MRITQNVLLFHALLDCRCLTAAVRSHYTFDKVFSMDSTQEMIFDASCRGHCHHFYCCSHPLIELQRPHLVSLACNCCCFVASECQQPPSVITNRLRHPHQPISSGMVEDFFNGFNCTVLAYGQTGDYNLCTYLIFKSISPDSTSSFWSHYPYCHRQHHKLWWSGSGKTFTMMGEKSTPGIIPRLVQNVFE